MSETRFNTVVVRPVECFKEAWEIIKDQYWLILAITIVGLLIGSAVPIVLVGAMMCGIYLVLFRKIDGYSIEFGDLFKGFDYFLPGLILSIVIMIPVFIMLFGMYVPIIAVTLTGQKMNESELFSFFAAVFIGEMIFVLLMVCLHTLLIFAFPLIVDRKLSAVNAIKTSSKAVWHNLSGIAGLMGVSCVVGIVGYLAFCIGIYFALPLIFTASAVAYRKIFPALPSQDFSPPSPSFYENL